MQSNSQSFHACFDGPREGPLEISPRFHPCEDEDIDTTLPWCISLEDDAQIESVGEASCHEYINQKKRDEEEYEAKKYWGPRRRMLYEEAARRRTPTPPRGREREIAPPNHYD